ncbi:hypothetical protein C8J57DRAFT_1283407 [Mycena rebaudengoi]|nr:hypothetical protein C8J57DRAFT_1283407 [Mycena rebaudengoi]
MPPPVEFSLESVETILRLMSSDDLRNLLTTNNPPSDAQIMYIRGACLPAIDAGLSRVEMKVQTDIGPDVEPTLNTPDDYQHYFTNARRQCEGILSHIRTLPAELLGEIFRHVAQFDSMPYMNYGHESGYQSATSLSQVCARWQTLALRDPALWKTIKVDLQEHFRSTDSLRNRLAQILERSRNHPLEIDVSVDDIRPCYVSGETCRHLLAPLFEQVHRWRTAKLYLPYREELRPLVHTGSGEAPFLETLDLDFHSESNSVVMLRNSPRLRTLIVGEGHCALDIPWQQLETLTLRPLACKSLRRLTVNYQPYFQSGNGPIPPALQLPSSTADCNNLNDIGCLVPLLERSNCCSTLTRLNYSKYNFAARADQFEVLDALHQLNNLEYLTFDSMLGLLQRRGLIASLGDADGFLPRLRYLSLHAQEHDAKGLFPYFGEEGDMVRAFERRWHKRDTPLQAVSIGIDEVALSKSFSRSPLAGPSQIYSACLTKDETTRMEALQKEGMKIQLIFGTGPEAVLRFTDMDFREYVYE